MKAAPGALVVLGILLLVGCRAMPIHVKAIQGAQLPPKPPAGSSAVHPGQQHQSAGQHHQGQAGGGSKGHVPAAAAVSSPPMLLFKHFPKAGGSYTKRLLDAALGQELKRDFSSNGPRAQMGQELKAQKKRENGGYVVLHEFEDLRPSDKRDFFTMGAVRHPCSYLLSLWAFGSDGKGLYLSQLRKKGHEDAYGKTPPYDSPADLQRFTKWLQLSAGVEWGRFFSNYRATGEGGQPGLGSLHCWAVTYNLVDDLRSCLRRFEAERGGKVNWAEFEKVNANPKTKSNKVRLRSSR